MRTNTLTEIKTFIASFVLLTAFSGLGLASNGKPIEEIEGEQNLENAAEHMKNIEKERSTKAPSPSVGFKPFTGPDKETPIEIVIAVLNKGGLKSAIELLRKFDKNSNQPSIEITLKTILNTSPFNLENLIEWVDLFIYTSTLPPFEGIRPRDTMTPDVALFKITQKIQNILSQSIDAKAVFSAADKTEWLEEELRNAKARVTNKETAEEIEKAIIHIRKSR